MGIFIRRRPSREYHNTRTPLSSFSLHLRKTGQTGFMHRLLVLPVIAACWATAVAFVAAERDNAAIDDDGHHPEYVAVYSLEATGTHTLKIGVPGGDAFEEDTLEFMVVPSSSGDHEGLEKAEEASEAGRLCFSAHKQSGCLGSQKKLWGKAT